MQLALRYSAAMITIFSRALAIGRRKDAPSLDRCSYQSVRAFDVESDNRQLSSTYVRVTAASKQSKHSDSLLILAEYSYRGLQHRPGYSWLADALCSAAG